jgi:hypothetical protein
VNPQLSNPTPLQVGAAGTLAGWRYRVAGRVVMGMEEEGETYTWNEFHLLDEKGASSTLVHEETERGGEWRLFYLFDPEKPLAAAEAAAKRAGDAVDLGGPPLRVTLVDKSRVLRVEGQAPEGVEEGDVARYFNAEGGGQMVVVSWTGEEVECFRGINLSAEAVAAAFGLPKPSASAPPAAFAFAPAAGTPPATSAKKALGCATVFLAAVVLGASWLSARAGRPSLPLAPAKPALPPAPLAVGSRGEIDGVPVTVEGHAVVEIARVDARFDRHEYHLSDGAGNSWLLAFGAGPGGTNPVLFTRFAPDPPLSPAQAAALRGGATVRLEGIPARVGDLSRVLVMRLEGRDLAAPAGGREFYGFTARSGTHLFLARWNARGLGLYRGRPFPAEAARAFQPPPK